MARARARCPPLRCRRRGRIYWEPAAAVVKVRHHIRLDQSVLVLFDIDGTLLDGATRGAGEAMTAALKEVHGVDTDSIRTHIPTAGRTDGEIARAILLDAGVSAERVDALADRVRDRYCEWCARLFPDDLSGCVLPGVRELLDWLTEQGGVKLALLTGNYEPVARLKVTRAGLGRAFASGQGAFGSDAEDRTALPEIARRRARYTRVTMAARGHDPDRRHAAGHRACTSGRSPVRGGRERAVRSRRTDRRRRRDTRRPGATARVARLGRRSV